ncbi:MAG: FHA domain-containing protein [Gemmatales bacterium]|nr:FHA domain-containing protein [Gemmatales bacterium]
MAQVVESPADWVGAASERESVERVGAGLPDQGFIVLRLRAVNGSRIIEIYQPEAILGRHSQADIRLAAAEVSRHHCRFVFESGQWYVEDLGSLNGTYVNEEPVQRAALQPGAILRVASQTFLVDWPQLDSTVDCPQPEAEQCYRTNARAQQILASIAEQLPDSRNS